MNDHKCIPPPEVRVRILNLESRRALYSNTRDSNAIGHIDSTTIYDDHYWYIQPGKGEYEGCYMFVSAYTGRALVVNWRNGTNGGNGDVSTSDKVGQYGDQYFDLTQTRGKGIRNTQFRIHSPSGQGNLFSRTHSKPELGCLHDSDKIYSDHWFTFELEPLELIRIKYDEENPEIMHTGIVHFPPQQAVNHTDVAQQQKRSFSKETEQQSTFTSEVGFSVSMMAGFSCGLPLFGDGKVEVTTTMSQNMAWGKTNSTRQKWDTEVTLNVGPLSANKVTASLIETRMRLPFVSVWKVEETGKEIQLKGTYEGQSCHKLSTVFSPVKYTPQLVDCY
jgi:hypothetical protein